MDYNPRIGEVAPGVTVDDVDALNAASPRLQGHKLLQDRLAAEDPYDDGVAATGGPSAEDMHTRWLPPAEMVEQAKKLIAATPGAEYAMLAMYQPGKTYGIWFGGQEVVTIPGVFFLAGNGPHLLPYSQARDAATNVAYQAMRAAGHTHGTTSYVIVYPDGQAVVFEDILHQLEK